MRRLTTSIFAGALAAGHVASAGSGALADVAASDSTAADLVVRSDTPKPAELERQFVAVWSPKVPMQAKIDASYNGAAARPALRRLFGPSRFDYSSLQGRSVGPVTIAGDRARAAMAGVMVGVPVSVFTYHYRRDDGRWKFDWKRTCDELKCAGNPTFGY